ncbi:hypothetical protein [Edaphobacter albus]|uniref:hypothetical protein n=1 Tax=Edaphobacter sp. 4G125 TaxID=2763071 RepID=UPI001648D551|nr:hypothetical protein [Edaphobacter sp. 4G125]QNI36958.1 hypothetical protein H7846_01030 [Edaphobacter sp. 4G125]
MKADSKSFNPWVRFSAITATCVAMMLPIVPGEASGQTDLKPQTMPGIGQVDARYLSYNIEAVEITGGRFWKPYKDIEAQQSARTAQVDENHTVGMDPALFQYRSPINLENPRLRKLTLALGPAYVRVSGTWRNSTYFQDNNEPALKEPPKGFNSVMTRAEWKGVVDFSRATDAQIVTSFSISPGVRDADGVWTPQQAKEVLDYTKQIGGRIAAAEFMNEPTYAVIGGAPRGYDATAFGKDVKVFKMFLRAESPATVFLGPGGVGEGVTLVGPSQMRMLSSEDLMKTTGPVFDAFSYHFYGGVSQRCAAGPAATMGTTATDALTAEWLDRANRVEAFYAKLRNAYLQGKPMWLTETGQTACGGDKWAAEFVDSFRFLDQLGALAQKSVKVVMHNTLAASDYGLLDEETLEPRPNYWAALLWKRTMGTRVLDPDVAPTENLRVFAQCMKGSRGGVSVLVLNLDEKQEQTIQFPLAGELYTLSAPALSSKEVLLNGIALKAAQDGTIPALKGKAVKAGTLRFAPLTISFVTLPDAQNASCMEP